MKRKLLDRGRRAAMLLAVLLIFTGITGSDEMVWSAGADSVYLSETSVVMAPATTRKLQLIGALSKVKWSSSNKKVAVVGRKGKVTAKAKGVTRIKAVYKKKEYVCNVVVKYMTYTASDGMRYKDVSGNFARTGRWFQKNMAGGKYYFTSTDGSAAYFKVTGSKYVDVNFLTNTSVSVPYFAYSVDGGNMKRQSVSKGKISVGDTKTHYVRLLIDAISEYENRWIGEAGVAIKSIKPVSKEGVVTAVKPQNDKIAFYGDSITKGVRALNMELTPSGTSAVHSYAWYCAQKLKMVPYYVGYGGSGIFETGSFQKCYNVIEKLSAGRKAGKFEADVIVVLHGTNDVYTYGDIYVSEYQKVLNLLHSKFPKAKIMAVIPFNQIHADEIRAAAASYKSWCSVVETASWNLSYTDGMHPNAKGAEKAGKNLAKKISSIRKKK